MEAFLKSIEMGQRTTRFRVPQLRPLAKGTAAVLVYWAVRAELEKRSNAKDLALKKLRLQEPVHDLTDDEILYPPWSGKEYDQWKYRLVRVTGRQIHRLTQLVPRKVHGYEGFDYIVPLVTSENEAFKEQRGLLLNKGWLPHEYKNPGARFRIEDAASRHSFIGMVTRGEDLDTSIFFKRGNVWDEQRYIWGNFYLPDMARATPFVNRDAVKQGVIELIDLDATPLDVNDPNHYARDMSGTMGYPHPKSLSGALQPVNSNDTLLKKQMAYGAIAEALILY